MQHELTLMIAVPVTISEAVEMTEANAITLTPEMMERAGGGQVGCYVCELPFEAVLLQSHCDGQPSSYASDGSPISRSVN